MALRGCDAKLPTGYNLQTRPGHKYLGNCGSIDSAVRKWTLCCDATVPAAWGYHSVGGQQDWTGVDRRASKGERERKIRQCQMPQTNKFGRTKAENALWPAAVSPSSLVGRFDTHSPVAADGAMSRWGHLLRPDRPPSLAPSFMLCCVDCRGCRHRIHPRR